MHDDGLKNNISAAPARLLAHRTACRDCNHRDSRFDAASRAEGMQGKSAKYKMPE